MANKEDALYTGQVSQVVYSYLDEKVATREKALLDRLVGQFRGGKLEMPDVIAALSEISALRALRDETLRNAKKLQRGT